MAIRQKLPTPEQIMKANLAKTLRQMKHKVADKEGLWLEFFQDAVTSLLSSYYDADEPKMETVVDLASALADQMLDAYETRWGKM